MCGQYVVISCRLALCLHGGAAPGGPARAGLPDLDADTTPLSGPLLAALRREVEHTSQRLVAERVGMSQPKLSRLLAGKGTITLETADRVAAAMGLTLGVQE